MLDGGLGVERGNILEVMMTEAFLGRVMFASLRFKVFGFLKGDWAMFMVYCDFMYGIALHRGMAFPIRLDLLSRSSPKSKFTAIQCREIRK